MDKEVIECIKNAFNEINNEDFVISKLEEIKKYNFELYLHSLRVCFLSIYLGCVNNFGYNKMKILGYAGLFHDIGKLDIPKEILFNGKNLTSKEKKIIKDHPKFGFLRMKGFRDDVGKIIIAHHEHQENPYPRRTTNSSIKNEKRKDNCNLCAFSKIIAVADEYDALRSERNYKKALPEEEIRKILLFQFKNIPKEYINQMLKKEEILEKIYSIEKDNYLNILI